MPFSVTVKVGGSYSTASWLDTTGISPLNDQIFTTDPGAVWNIPETVEIWESGAVDTGPLVNSYRDDVKDLFAFRFRSTWAGVLTTGWSGGGMQEGDRLGAVFFKPFGLAMGPDGVLYVADTYNNKVRRIE